MSNHYIVYLKLIYNNIECKKEQNKTKNKRHHSMIFTYGNQGKEK